MERNPALDAAAKAIAHPLRRAAIAAAMTGTVNRYALARALEYDQRPNDSVGARIAADARARRLNPTVGYHLRELERAGILELDRTSQQAGTVQRYYRLASTPAAALARTLLKAAATHDERGQR